MEMGLCFVCDKPFTPEHHSAHKNILFVVLENEEEFDQENEDNSLSSETLFTNDSTSFPFDSKNRETPPWSNPAFPNGSAVSIEVQAGVADLQESFIHNQHNQQAPTQNHEAGSVHEDEGQKVHESGAHKSDLAIPIKVLNVAATEALLSSDSGNLIGDEDIEKSQVEGNAFTLSSRMLPPLAIDSYFRFCFNFALQQFVLFPPPEPPDGIVAPTLSHSLINFYAKCEYYTYAQQMLDEMPDQDVVSFLQQHSLLSSILFPPISSRASPSSAYLLSSSEMRKTPATIPPPKPPDAVTDPALSINPCLSVLTAACCTELQYPVSVCYRSLPTASQVFDEMPKGLVAVWIVIILTKNESEVVALDLSKVSLSQSSTLMSFMHWALLFPILSSISGSLVATLNVIMGTGAYENEISRTDLIVRLVLREELVNLSNFLGTTFSNCYICYNPMEEAWQLLLGSSSSSSAMGKAKKGPKFAVKKKLVSSKAIKNYKEEILNPEKKNPLKEKLPRNVPTHSSALFFQYNTALGPPYRVLVDTNFINFSIQNKLDLEKGMMDCLYAKCTPCITDCVMAELEKLGQKYRVALRIAKDPRFQRLLCDHKGTYADDCLVERVTEHKCFIVATCDRDLKRRIRKIPGVPIMYITKHKYSIERLPEATMGGAPRI